MRQEFYYDSCGIGKIHAVKWVPDSAPKAVFQIIHGIAEHILRYDDFAKFLNKQGILVVAEDHMGHGQSIGNEGTQGYFNGGWFSAVEDSYQLLKTTKAEYPDLPYILFGHSMGSFMARTILVDHPDSGIAAAIICGTGWQPKALLKAGVPVFRVAARNEKQEAPKLQNMIFGSYNKKVEHQRTGFDWLTRDDEIVDAYIADPLCGFVATGGLLRDLLIGIDHVQNQINLDQMKKDLPVLFVAGGDDPVGNYGTGVRKAADAFRLTGMEDVSVRIYPLCRHEILNEINKDEIYGDILDWIQEKGVL